MIVDPEVPSDRSNGEAAPTEVRGARSNPLVRRQRAGLAENRLERHPDKGANGFVAGPPLSRKSRQTRNLETWRDGAAAAETIRRVRK